MDTTELVLRQIQADISKLRAEVGEARDETAKRLAAIEKAQERFRVRQAIMETRQNDLTGDLAAIARVVERAKLLDL